MNTKFKPWITAEPFSLHKSSPQTLKHHNWHGFKLRIVNVSENETIYVKYKEKPDMIRNYFPKLEKKWFEYTGEMGLLRSRKKLRTKILHLKNWITRIRRTNSY